MLAFSTALGMPGFPTALGTPPVTPLGMLHRLLHPLGMLHRC